MLSLSSPRLVTLAALAVAFGLAACGAKNPNFCEGADCDAIDAAIDAPPVTCTASGADPSCPAANPVCVSGACTGLCDGDADCAVRPTSEAVCLVATGACVACDEDDVQAATLAEDECPAANQAVCDGETHTCRACEAHSECLSGVCDAGRCAPAAEVVYMTADGTDGGNNCDNRAPTMGCLTLNFAISKLTVTRKYILMAPSATPYDARNNTDRADFNGDTAHVIGYGAKVRRTGTGEVLDIHGGANVILEGLEVSNGLGLGLGTGIKLSASRLELRRASVKDNANIGLDITGASQLRITRSRIANNGGGGILMGSGGEFVIVNTVIAQNGNINSSAFGGLNLTSIASTNVFEFNTVAENAASVGTADQMICNNGAVAFTARNNIIATSSGAARPRISGSCLHTFTVFAPDGATAGTGNVTVADPAMLMLTADFHIGASSVAAGKASAAALAGDTLIDIDGDARTLNGTTVDVGADEIP